MRSITRSGRMSIRTSTSRRRRPGQQRGPSPRAARGCRLARGTIAVAMSCRRFAPPIAGSWTPSKTTRSRASRSCTGSSSISATLPPGAPVRLLMRGFTDYFTATSMFAALQANVSAIAPYVEAQRADGSWTRVADDIGFPGRTAAHDGRRSHRQTAVRHAAHSHLDQPEGLLGPDPRRHDARRRGAGRATRSAAGRGDARIPRLPARSDRGSRQAICGTCSRT